MTVVLLFLAICCMYYLSFIFSIAASGLYLSDYEEEQFIASLPEKKKPYFQYLLSNTKRLAITADIVQSASLIISTICWYILGSAFDLPSFHKITIEALLVVLGWIIYLSLVVVVAPGMNQDRVLGVVQKKYWLLSSLITVSSPFVSLMMAQKQRVTNKTDLEEKREGIVGRAIESLADSAGITEPIVEKDVKRMIGNIFDLADSDVREVMVPRTEMLAIEKGSTLEDVKSLVAESGHSRFPVYENDLDRILGVLYVKDIFTMSPSTDATKEVTSLARPAYFVPESKRLDSLLEEFKVEKTHIAIVVDEYGGTAGMVTLEDLLELIVGDIHGEHVDEEADLVKVSENEYIVSANLSMDDLAERLELNLEEKDFATVGGYIYDLVGSLPHVGQKVQYDGIDYIVEKVAGQRIDKVRVVLREKKR